MKKYEYIKIKLSTCSHAYDQKSNIILLFCCMSLLWINATSVLMCHIIEEGKNYLIHWIVMSYRVLHNYPWPFSSNSVNFTYFALVVGSLLLFKITIFFSVSEPHMC